MYKIYIHESLLIITDKLYEKVDWKISHHDNFPWSVIISQLEEVKHPLTYWIQSDDIERVWSEFTTHFSIIIAAGGIVKNLKNQYLVIKRLGKYDLPKGKVEELEDIEQAAIREVEEECSISKLNILNLDPIISYHTYKVKKTRILKKTFWYEMSCCDEKKPAPQVEEGISDVKWVQEDEFKNLLEDSYPNIKNLLKTYLKRGK